MLQNKLRHLIDLRRQRHAANFAARCLFSAAPESQVWWQVGNQAVNRHMTKMLTYMSRRSHTCDVYVHPVTLCTAGTMWFLSKKTKQEWGRR